jgi:lysophospholipase L1-like esterase
MRRWMLSIVVVIALAAPILLVAQQGAPVVPAAPGAAAPGPGGPADAAPGGARGARGPAGPAAPANVPLARDDNRHKTFVEIAKGAPIELLFVGDSITDGWRNGGQPIWDQNWAQYKPANFGIGGDTTQGVLWRMQNGELDGYKARLIVLMLGTNNINRNPNDEIVDGDRLIVEEFKKRQPQAKVLVLGIFPRAVKADDPYRASIKDINSKLAKLADNKQVFFMDFGEKFLAPDGTLTPEIMPDALHPNLKGYKIWAEAMAPRVKQLIK